MTHPPDAAPQRLTARAAGPLRGAVRAPGDKSISHRAVMLGALAVGRTRVSGLLEGEDVLATAEAFRRMGAGVTRGADGVWTIDGVGLGGLREPADVLDMGNSGTAARLLMGVLAGHPIRCFLTGDASLRKRPMNRVADPLRRMGARIETRSGGRLPLMIEGAEGVLPIRYELPVASAQVKSAVLLAGLMARGETTVLEPAATRDHTERMLGHFGASVRVEPRGEGPDGRLGPAVTLLGEPELTAADIHVPADPSSAAFPIVAALVTPGSAVRVTGVGLNPTRTGLFTTLREMGADLAIENEREEGGEPLGDLVARHSALTGVEVPPERAPSMIDEYPILCVAAAFAEGETVMRGVEELRVKESDRIAAMEAALAANGVSSASGADWMTVTGCGPADGKRGVAGGGTVQTHLDHRIAMSALVLGLAARAPVAIDDARAIATSFPDFQPLMMGLGANFYA
ncbi:MAG: 3-phosphoshikimate 1-carboxyvinyltransferase [Marivibrio sp.]|uniref:3-phosphoshikimate 1-carboxyvinyltransferase n=1 Tax=Marivibrio sp. TaxID=2039719 RepID=UPI0032EDEE7B